MTKKVLFFEFYVDLYLLISLDCSLIEKKNSFKLCYQQLKYLMFRSLIYPLFSNTFTKIENRNCIGTTAIVSRLKAVLLMSVI